VSRNFFPKWITKPTARDASQYFSWRDAVQLLSCHQAVDDVTGSSQSLCNTCQQIIMLKQCSANLLDFLRQVKASCDYATGNRYNITMSHSCSLCTIKQIYHQFSGFWGSSIPTGKDDWLNKSWYFSLVPLEWNVATKEIQGSSQCKGFASSYTTTTKGAGHSPFLSRIV
jgi:hypothetical protein